MSTASAALFRRAQRVIPGGAQNPVRAFQAVGGTPVYLECGQGAHVYTADGEARLDFCGSWGALILGHAHPKVVEAIAAAAGRGASLGANNRREVEFAELLGANIPYLEMVRLVTSGTEANLTAVRLARGATGRRLILAFAGCYHGPAEGLLAPSGPAATAGVSPAAAADVIVAPYNDLAAVRALLAKHGAATAAIIVEPVAANMGLVPPAPGFLAGLRQAADRAGGLLIFDEVLTGFRLGPTAYGALCGVVPDLTCLGQIIGGGLPLGAVGGRAALMNELSSLGQLGPASAESGNPVAIAAGAATLTLLCRENPYAELNRLGRRLAAGLTAAAATVSTPLYCAQLGSLFTPFFGVARPANLKDAQRTETRAYAAFFHRLLERGFYLPPDPFAVGFVSTAHSAADIDRFVLAAAEALRSSPLPGNLTPPAPGAGQAAGGGRGRQTSHRPNPQLALKRPARV